MHKRFFSFALSFFLSTISLYGDSFESYKQAFLDTNYTQIFEIYRKNIHQKEGEIYKEYLHNEISKTLTTHSFHAQKLINKLLELEPNNTYGRYFLALSYFEEKNYITSQQLILQLKEGYLELDLKTKVENLANQLSLVLTPQKKEKTIALQKSNNQFFIEVIIDNQKLKLLVDTGASITMLNNSIAQKLFHRVLEDPITIQTASGNTKASKIEVQNIKIAEIVYDNIEIISSNENVFQNFDGLLGMNILKHFQLDAKNSQLIYEK